MLKNMSLLPASGYEPRLVLILTIILHYQEIHVFSVCTCAYICMIVHSRVSYNLKYSNQSMNSWDLKDSNQAPTFQSTNYKCFYYCYL